MSEKFSKKTLLKETSLRPTEKKAGPALQKPKSLINDSMFSETQRTRVPNCLKLLCLPITTWGERQRKSKGRHPDPGRKAVSLGRGCGALKTKVLPSGDPTCSSVTRDQAHTRPAGGGACPPLTTHPDSLGDCGEGGEIWPLAKQICRS